MMSQRRFSPGLIAGIIVALFFGVALYLRIALPYDKVFVGDWIKFTEVDAYFFMRIVDNLVHNFPHLNSFDPYMLYPGGGGTGSHTFFVYFLAGITWLVGLGSPTQHTVDVVGVYFPAVLGALTVIPVYFIGKALFSRWAGVIAAGLIAIFPGEFLGRSLLGFTDYHVAEVLFTTITMLFLILAVKSATQSGMTFKHVKSWDWRIISKPFIYSLLAGIFLGIYFLTWMGALLFVLIIFVYLIIQFVIDHLKSRSTDYLCFVSTITFLVALLMFLPTSPSTMSLAPLVIAILVPIALAVLSSFMASRGIKPFFYPVALLGLGLVSLAILHVINPALLRGMMGSLAILTAWPIGTTVLEMQPILFPGGDFSWAVVWGNFTTGFFISFISLGILIYLIIKRGETDKTLLIVWSLVMLAATLSMRRFAYYFVVNVALLTGYFSWLILEFAGFKERVAEPAESPQKMKKKAKQKQRQKSGSKLSGSPIIMAFGIIVVFFLSFFPNIGGAINTASRVAFAPSDAWCESLSWMRDNTPDPFGNPDFYYDLYEPPPPGESYDYPQTAYGVTAWWDYGYWITRIGHRIPTSNPGTGHHGESSLFTAQDETSANKWIDWRGLGYSRYIIIDQPIVTTKFHAVATLSGSRPENFYDIYYQPQDNKLAPVRLFYPEYYRSLAVRIYNFDGRQVTPEMSNVISYEERAGPDGKLYKVITGAKSFSSYEEAEAYISSQESDNCRIVNADPFVSPVPLEELEHYELIYSSDSSAMKPDGGRVSEVKVFAYTPSPIPTVQTLENPYYWGASANLRGKLLSQGTAFEVEVSFLWGRTEDCDESETITEVMSLPGEFACDLSDLSPDTTYYYKAKAVGDVTSYGEVESFTTLR
ncbi:MAG: oligosaccharyl transferase, archaeosortase A system-associated [Dehalococcoidia bacterium]|nr:oligosaccharyl transferase, archaeosortase A system-associated [Dehalococcoidia bacterium]